MSSTELRPKVSLIRASFLASSVQKMCNSDALWSSVSRLAGRTFPRSCELTALRSTTNCCGARRCTPAAYAHWAFNWVHAFGDGNGKTARAVMYAILCVGYERMLPGEPAIPDLISRNPYSYVDALKAAHQAW